MTAVAGLASGMLFLALVSGVSAMPVIGYFVQLPLFFAGLSMGFTSAAFASAGSLGVVLISAGVGAASIYALTQVLPVVVLVRYALWSRGAGERGQIEWYPAGLLLSKLVLLVVAVTLAALTWTIIRSGSLDALFVGAMTDLEAALVNQGMPPGLAERFQPLLPFLPGFVASSWLVMVVVNGSLGQWLAGRQGQALRPAPSMRSIHLEPWMLPAFAVASLGAYLLEGNALYLTAAAAIVLAMPILFQGLAVVHTLAGRLRTPRLALFGFYMAFMLFAWPLAFVVLALGIAESFAHIRQRVAQ